MWYWQDKWTWPCVGWDVFLPWPLRNAAISGTLRFSHCNIAGSQEGAVLIRRRAQTPSQRLVAQVHLWARARSQQRSLQICGRATGVHPQLTISPIRPLVNVVLWTQGGHFCTDMRECFYTNGQSVFFEQSLLIEGRGKYNCSLLPESTASPPGCLTCNASSPWCAPHVIPVTPGETYRLRIASVASLSTLNFILEVSTSPLRNLKRYLTSFEVVHNSGAHILTLFNAESQNDCRHGGRTLR